MTPCEKNMMETPLSLLLPDLTIYLVPHELRNSICSQTDSQTLCKQLMQ